LDAGQSATERNKKKPPAGNGQKKKSPDWRRIRPRNRAIAEQNAGGADQKGINDQHDAGNPKARIFFLLLDCGLLAQ